MLCSQATDESELFEVIHIKVKLGQEKAFEEVVKKHNLQYHKEGTPYEAHLYYLVNGPDGGQYAWIMGPTNYSAMDTRPDDDAHEKDWSSVVTYAESISAPIYWRSNPALTYRGTDGASDKSLIYMYDIKVGQYDKFKSLVDQAKEVYATKRPEESLLTFFNDFADTKAGKDAGILFPLKNWGVLDKDPDFPKLFNEVHGKGSYDLFKNGLQECVNGRSDVLRVKIN